MNKKFSRVFILISFVLTFLFTISCQIGLGAAVDTEPPVINIQTPQVDVIIRDTFAISGSWSDDGTIQSITVLLERTDGNGSAITRNAEFAVTEGTVGEGTWTCILNPKDDTEKIIDGSYQATVTITDGSGHKTIQTRTFTIDNTPPVVILQSLKSKDDTENEIKTYGKLFTLNGKAADVNNIGRIDVHVYSNQNCEGDGFVITKLNIPATIEQNVATFGTDDYTQIYGSASEDNGTVERFCKVYAYDDAQRYPIDGSEQSEEDKLGNCQTSYYLQTIIEKLGYDAYKTTELYSMFNGTYNQESSRALSESEVSTVISTLNKNAVTIGTFKLNPKNNPTFTVIGLNKALPAGESMVNSDGDVETVYQITNGDADSGIPLTISVTPGRDNYAIDNSTLRMYFKECDANGKIKTNGTEIEIPNANKATSVKTAPVSTVNFSGLKTDTYYKICVDGTDTKGTEILPDTSGIYAFYLAPLNGVIELSVTGTPEYISTDEAADSVYKSFKVNLKYSYTGEANDLKLYRSFNSVPAENATPMENVTLTSGVDVSYIDTISASALEGITSVYYHLKNADGSSYSRDRSVNVKMDNTKPSVVSVKLPDAKDTSENSFKFEGVVSDTGAGIRNINVKLLDEVNSKEWETLIAGTTNWSLTIIRDGKFNAASNPSYGGVLAKDGKKKIVVDVTDGVGLKSEVYEQEWNYKATKPSFSFTGYTPSGSSKITKEANLMSNEGSFSTGKAFVIEGSIDDEYGIKSVTCSRGTVVLDIENKKWTLSENNLPEEGKTAEYEYIFTITDKADIEYTSKALKVSIDRKPPKVTAITLPGTESFGDTSLSGLAYNFKGTAVDEAPSIGMKAVRYAIKKIGETVADSDWEDSVLDGENWSFTKNLGTGKNGNDTAALYEGKYTLHVKAFDNADNESVEKTLDFCVDQSLPTVTLEIYKGDSTTPVTAQQDGSYLITDDVDNIHFVVTATDANDIKRVTAKNGDSEITLTHESETDIWTSENLTEGEYKLSVLVEDESGNNSIEGKKTSVNKTVLFDKSKPRIAISNADATSTAKTSWFKGEGTQYFTGTASDVGSGIAKIEVKVDSGSWETIATSDNWTYTYSVPENFVENTEEDYHTITLRITDNAGNKNNANGETYYFRYDKAAPTLTLETTADSVNASKSVLFKGKVEDGNSTRKVKSLILTGKLGDKTKTYTSTTLCGDYTFTVTGSELADLEEGNWVFTLTATDLAGNSVSKNATLTVDKTPPSIASVKADVAITNTSDNSKKANGTDKKWYNKQTIAIVVNASDTNGSGIETVEWRTCASDSSATDANAEWTPLTKKTDENKTTYNGSVIFDTAAAKENSQLHIRATDKAGNSVKFATASGDYIVFNIDTRAPVLTLTENIIPTYMKAGGIDVTGTVSDNFELAKTNALAITETFKPSTGNPVTTTEYVTSVNGLSFTANQSQSWTKHIPFTEGEGTYEYTFTLTDAAGNTSEPIEKSTISDSKAPKITNVTIGGKAYSNSNWYKSQTLSIEVSAEDEGDSNINTVEYTIDAADATNRSWTALTPDATGKYKGPVEFATSGSGKSLYIRASDKAGNIKYYDGTSTNGCDIEKAITINIDTTAPSLTHKFYQIANRDLKTISDTVYVNSTKTEDVVLYGTISDAESGIEELTVSGFTVSYSTTDITSLSASDLKTRMSSSNEDKITFGALPSDTTSVKSWKAVKTFTAEGSSKISLSGTNKAGSSSEALSFTIIRDVTPPAIPSFTLEDTTTANTPIPQYSPSTGIYYVNNKVNSTSFKKFTLSGTASDKYGIASVTISGVTKTNSGTAEDWKFADFTIEGENATAKELVVTVVDNAGNSNTQTITVNIDTQAPNGIHVLDSANKDLYFRIGDMDRDVVNGTETEGTITTVITGAPEVDSTENGQDKKVGGKYAGNTYGDTESITLRGRFEDSGSGVERIYYKVVQTSPDDTNIASDFLASYETLADGYFLLGDEETKRVFYSDGENGDGTIKRKDDGTYDSSTGKSTFTPVHGTTIPVTITTTDSSTNPATVKTKKQYYSDVKTNYKTVISNFKPGENYLMFVAVDKVGNANYETVTYMGVEHHDYRINIDQTSPNIENNNEVKYSNGTQTISISGKVNDALAGIASMEVYTTIPKEKGGTEKKKITFDVTLTNNGSEHPATTDATVTDEVKNSRYKLWTANIDTSTITYDDGTLYDGTVSLNATARDKAGKGNPATVGIGSIIMDIKPTNVSLAAPTDADEYTDGRRVNGTISLSGTAKDENGLSADSGSLVLYYTRNTTLGAKTKTTIAAADIKADNDTDATHTPDTHFVKLDDTVANDTSWTFTGINTANLKKSTTAADATENVWFMVASKDVAGNFGYSDPCAVIVDPHSDRPVILFEEGISLASTMASSSPSWVKNRQIKGKVKDDDGVTHLYYSFTGNESDWSSDCLDSDKRGFTINLNSNGSDDDKHTIYFKVVETGGKEYITKAATDSNDALNTPKLRTNDKSTDSENVIIGNSTGKYDTTLYVNIDLKNPDILVKHYTVQDLSEYFEKENGSYKVTNVDTALITDNQPNNSFEWEELKSSFTTGGPSNYLYVLVKATDANGINSITLKDGTTGITGDNKREAVDVNSTTALFRIDVSSIDKNDAKEELEITVTDRAEKTNTNSSTVTIDRKAPVVTITTPSSGSSVYGNEGVPAGSVTVSGNTVDDHHVSNVYFAITKSENDQPSDNESDVNCWTKMTTENASAIYAIFNGDTGNDKNGIDAYYGELFNWYVDGLYGAGTSVREDRKDVCLWFYAEDEYGNSGKSVPTKVPLLILTQGDKPEVNISYPTTGGKVGGTITLSGSTSIATDTVDKVYIQIDPDYDSSSFSTANWESRMNKVMYGRTDLGYEIVNTNLTGTANSDKTRAIVANGSAQSWYLNINMQHEFDNDDNSNRKIAVRVFAVGKNNGKVSNVQTVNFTLDPGSPIFGNTEALRLVQYENNVSGTGEEKASLLYTKDMWIKGKWWLTGSVEDDSGIQSLTLNEKEGERRNVTTISTLIKTGNEGIITGKGYILNIPVGVPEDNENCYANLFDIVATDGEHSTTQEISLNYDNTAPTFSANLEASGNSIVQSQGSYTISGSFKDENGSGFKRIAFYVTRKLSNVDYLTDIMGRQGTTTTGIPNNCVALTGFTAPASGAADLYWKTITGCTANSTEITLPSSESIPSYVHVGGLCRINNVIYRIEGVNESSKTITLDQKVNSGTVNVEFTVAQVIDNTVSESGITTYYGDETNLIANDDHDYMCESYSNSDGSWSVTINSKNIKDGAITLHFVAYDKAGNAIATSYNATVANNRPRIAGVKFGSDVDGSGTVETSEMKTMYAGIYRQGHDNRMENVTVSGQTPAGKSIYTLAIPNNSTKIDTLYGKPVLTVKGKVKVVPEIVGGNDGLSWTYYINSNKSDDNIVKENGTRKVTTIVNTHSDDIRVDEDGNDVETAINLELSDIVGHYTDDGQNDFHFQIWDHTEGLTPGTNSNRADLSLRFYVALKDGVAPEANIRPFYWKDSEHNSVFYENNVAKGHIELEDDLPEGTFNVASTDTSGLYDNDPKVSGIIYLEGTAKDNVVVEEILMKFPGLTTGTDFVTVAKRNRTAGSEDLGKWEAKTSLATNGFEFDSTSVNETTETDSATGLDKNVVNFRIKINTAKITGTAGTDKKIQIQAKDRGGITAVTTNNVATYSGIQSSTESAAAQTKVTAMVWSSAKNISVSKYRDLELTDQIGTKDKLADDVIVYLDERTPTYKVDVVPYIVRIETGITSSAGSEFTRSARGRYIVRENETVNLYGFNLVSGSTVNIGSGTATTSAGGVDANGIPYLNLPIGTNSSGDVYITTNSVISLNNQNKNPTIDDDDKITAVAYNSQADGKANDRLTDDVSLWVWTFGAFDTPMNTTNITSPMMKFDTNGNYYISYGNGPKEFAIDKNGSRTILEACYNKYHNTNIAYDTAGNFYGVATDTDRINTTTSGSTSFTFFSRAKGYRQNYNWLNGYYLEDYISDHGNYYTGSNKRRLELSQYGGTNNSENDTGTYNINRVQRPKLTVSGGGTAENPANIYIAYYDSSAKNIKFRYGKVTGEETYTGNERNGYSFTSKMSGGISNDLSGNGTDSGTNSSSATGYQVIADKENATTFKAGEYVAVGYTNDDKTAVAAWYDSGTRRLVYSYKSLAADATDTWQGNAVYLDGEYTGWHVDLVVDDANKVHIAYYNSKNGDLKYAYIDGYDQAKTAGKVTKVTVDSYLSVGTNITINVRKEGTGTNAKNVPYIYYYNTSSNNTPNSIKVAWQYNSDLSDGARAEGANKDHFTGAWECMTVPTTNIPLDATVCGGVPTDKVDAVGDFRKSVVLGYMTDQYFEKAYIKGDITAR